MRTAIALALLLSIGGTAQAQCRGQIAMRPNKAGVMREVCLDRSYSTCIKDGRAGGWSGKEVKAFCDKQKAAGVLIYK
ncbi:MAG: hypothetical protein AB7K67_13230 [Hyphomicrobiaceae bacterium]